MSYPLSEVVAAMLQQLLCSIVTGKHFPHIDFYFVTLAVSFYFPQNKLLKSVGKPDFPKMPLLVQLVFVCCVALTCDHKLKTTQQRRTRGKQGLRIVWLMIHFNSLRTTMKPKISGSVPDQRLKVDTKFDLTRVLVSMV